jgi:hypothetical protein
MHMNSHPARRARLPLRALGWLAVVGMLAAAMLGPSAVAVSATEATNPTCADLGYSLSFKIDTGQLEEKTYTSSTAAVETNWSGQAITITNLSDDGQTFDFSATLAVGAVFVKAGDTNSNLYTYSPAVTAAAGLTHGGGTQAISHLLFCGDAAAPTASPSVPPTESPSVPPTGSPSVPPTESPTVPPTGSPSVPPTDSPSPTGSELPIEAMTCADLGLELMFAINGELTATTYTGADATVVTNWDGQAITIANLSGDGLTFDLSATLPFSAVIVSGDVGASAVATFSPAVTTASGLTATAGATMITSVEVCGDAAAPTDSPSPTGGVGGVTGAPVATLPPTDSAPGASPSAGAWSVVLIAMAALLAAILLLTPARLQKASATRR